MLGRGPRKLLLAVACLLCCAAVAPAMAAADEPGAISGTVAEVGGGPIEGLEVQATGMHGEGSGSALTDGSGNYEIDDLPEGEYEVEFTGTVCAAGNCALKYALRFWEEVKPFAEPTPVLVEAEETTENIDEELELNGSIEGTLTDSLGAPIADSLVCVNSHTEYHPACVFSKANGEFDVPDLPPGEFDIEFSGRVCAGGSSCETEPCQHGQGCPQTYVKKFWEEALSEEGATLVTVLAGQALEGIDTTLSKGARIKGKVTVAALGSPPLAGFDACAISNSANGACAQTDANGEYTIEGLAEATDWIVQFSEVCPEEEPCPGAFETQFFDGKAEEGEADQFELKPGDVKTGIDVSIEELLPQIPSFVTDPVVTGIPVVSRKLSCTEGRWAGNPTSLRFAWLRNGIPITGAEASTYTAVAEDEGNDVTCEVTIENSAGSKEALSDNVHIGPEVAPASTTQPTLSGTPAVGSTLACSEGAAINYPQSTSFAWLRDGTAIAGQAGPTYNVTKEDEGALLTCKVTMTNGAGSAGAGSNGLTVPKHEEEKKSDQPTNTGGSSSGSSTTTVTVLAPVPPPGTASAGSGKATTGRSVSIKLTCSGQAACQGSLKLTYEQKGKQVVIGTASFNIAVGKSQTIAVKLNARGEELVAKAGKAGLKVKLSGSGVKARTLTVH